jgi:hypothetical protein
MNRETASSAKKIRLEAFLSAVRRCGVQLITYSKTKVAGVDFCVALQTTQCWVFERSPGCRFTRGSRDFVREKRPQAPRQRAASGINGDRH